MPQSIFGGRRKSRKTDLKMSPVNMPPPAKTIMGSARQSCQQYCFGITNIPKNFRYYP